MLRIQRFKNGGGVLNLLDSSTVYNVSLSIKKSGVMRGRNKAGIIAEVLLNNRIEFITNNKT